MVAALKHCCPGMYIRCDFLLGNQNDVTFKIFTNPSDPTVVMATTPDGEEIFVIGDKTTDGLLEAINEFHIVDSDNIMTIAELNDDGEISFGVDSTGQKIELEWEEDYTGVFVSVTLADGAEQITDHIDFTEPDVDDDAEEMVKRDLKKSEVVRVRPEEQLKPLPIPRTSSQKVTESKQKA